MSQSESRLKKRSMQHNSKRGKSLANTSELVWLLPLIGWKCWTTFSSQSPALTDKTDIQLKVAAHPRIYQLVHLNPTPHLEDLSKPLPRKREMSENEDTQTFISIIILMSFLHFPTFLKQLFSITALATLEIYFFTIYISSNKLYKHNSSTLILTKFHCLSNE